MSRRNRWSTNFLDRLSPSARQYFLRTRAQLRDEASPVAASTPTPTYAPYADTPIGARPFGAPARMGNRPWLRGTDTTGAWCVSTFLPMYIRMRQLYANDPVAIAKAVASHCGIDNPEIVRRIHVATVVLLRHEGVALPMPQAPSVPRPADADGVRQPWMRALLTGWI